CHRTVRAESPNPGRSPNVPHDTSLSLQRPRGPSIVPPAVWTCEASFAPGVVGRYVRCRLRCFAHAPRGALAALLTSAFASAAHAGRWSARPAGARILRAMRRLVVAVLVLVA